jgi:hypothetical protein
MLRRRIVAVMAIAIGPALACPPPPVEAGGKGPEGDPRFLPTLGCQVAGKPTRLVLTGTAMRTKFGFSVYAIGSYVQEGTKVRDAEALARIAVAKQLHLIFERDVDGATMAQSFRDAIGLNHPAPAFAAELEKLEQFFRSHPARRGDRIVLTTVPGAGLTCEVSDQPRFLIESTGFSQATWEVYLGRKNLGTGIKSGLTSRL